MCPFDEQFSISFDLTILTIFSLVAAACFSDLEMMSNQKRIEADAYLPSQGLDPLPTQAPLLVLAHDIIFGRQALKVF